MKKTIILTLILGSLLLAACQNQATVQKNDTIYNETINQELENLTQMTPSNFTEFTFTPKDRLDAKYEISRDDIFELSNGTFNSSEISVFGVMIGDSYEQVLDKMGIPDVMFTPSDKSYTNMEYGRKIGVESSMTALTFHLENDQVTRISMRNSFKKYTNGNTTFGTSRDYLYSKLDLPDYQDFTSSYKVFHYVELGMDLYMRQDKIDIFSFVKPQEFKGVKYVSALEEIAPGVVVNTTKAVLIE